MCHDCQWRIHVTLLLKKQGPLGQRCVLTVLKWLYEDVTTWDSSWLILALPCLEWYSRNRDRADRQIDGPTDRWMDRPSYRDSRMHLVSLVDILDASKKKRKADALANNSKTIWGVKNLENLNPHHRKQDLIFPFTALLFFPLPPYCFSWGK